MKDYRILVTLIPIIGLAFFLFYSPKEVNNKRMDVQTFESKLKNQDSYPVETATTPFAEVTTKVLTEGQGEREVKAGDTVTVNYRGWLASDGSIFDQSFNRGDSGFTFTVGEGVIVGWSNGVQGMKEGEVRRLYVPSALGYGEAGAGASIPGNSDLIFDVELIKFED
jgi:FKBP-type peptidyl-prolyl cis-trans isomerase